MDKDELRATRSDLCWALAKFLAYVSCNHEKEAVQFADILITRISNIVATLKEDN